MNTDESIRFATKYLEDLLSFFGINVAVYSTIEDDVIQLSIPSTSMNSLLIGKNDTVESWMKVGNANAMADILIAQNKCKPCKIIVTNQTNGGISINADDYSSWQERIAALEKVLISMN